ncbi:MAG TPA: DMT family transporter [Methanocorpusculum sp.]|nr:DMT family transporter [Methanocorpusculum sp.]HJJ72256.1 DMT family transporter [Methanocorpusculum sp.]HJJ74943.1 DMT family transporter [Methanocorpusculum sp.]HJJ75707.1 DMT family transporter [Methanocorpusculum sp.]HJJ78524.1 DMT family transporter [Methanocorpusculum sp.]
MNLKGLLSSVLFCSILVLLASCSYAVLSTIVSLAVRAGYGIDVVLVGKFFYGWVILLIISAIVFAVRKRQKISWDRKRVMCLAGTGIVMALVTVCYFHSLSYLPISLAVVLLFQYSWMGVVIESAANKRLPSKSKTVSCLVILAGTILAGGIIGSTISLSEMNPIGILLGLSAAFCYALFVFLSGRVSTDMPPLSKSFSISTFGMLFVLLFVGTVYGGTAVLEGITNIGSLVYSIPLGIFGIAVPILFLAVGAPKISTGMATILNSAELPLEVLLAALIILEPVGPLRWIGVVIILLGIALPYIMEKRIVSGFEVK